MSVYARRQIGIHFRSSSEWAAEAAGGDASANAAVVAAAAGAGGGSMPRSAFACIPELDGAAAAAAAPGAPPLASPASAAPHDAASEPRSISPFAADQQRWAMSGVDETVGGTPLRQPVPHAASAAMAAATPPPALQRLSAGGRGGLLAPTVSRRLEDATLWASESVGSGAAAPRGAAAAQAPAVVAARPPTLAPAEAPSAAPQNFEIFSSKAEVERKLSLIESRMREFPDRYPDERIADVLALYKLRILGDTLRAKSAKSKVCGARAAPAARPADRSRSRRAPTNAGPSQPACPPMLCPYPTGHGYSIRPRTPHFCDCVPNGAAQLQILVSASQDVDS